MAIFPNRTAETTLKIMMKEAHKLSLFFSNEFPFNKEGLEEFVNTFVIKSCKKGEIVLENGNIKMNFVF